MPSKKSAANQTLGKALRAARLSRGYNQEVFARRAELERSNYGAIERGEFNVTLDTIVQIAGGMELSVAELLARAGL